LQDIAGDKAYVLTDLVPCKAGKSLGSLIVR
jgi:hypothetical protein